MKTVTLLIALILTSSYAMGQDLGETKLLSQNSVVVEKIYDSIIRDTYFEDDGYERIIPQENFEFDIVEISIPMMTIEAKGSGYSPWDDKVIDYACTAYLNVIDEEYEVTGLKCELENENWPFG